MSDQTCSHCGHLLEDGDAVRALIETKFKGLKSKVHYALERPTACLEVYHQSCQFTKGVADEDLTSD